ncbi:MAG: hypothetical protein QNJ46_03580 [Leptolyngbyaceae cyanobacterium MO_188.B28]|nr:hypothetical protein [Leptolyngbyaceae cyanobacterium MO_188.B28]
MTVKQVYYEELLSTCSHYTGAIELLRRYRPYLETLPSMRRPNESIVTIPLPNIRIRQSTHLSTGKGRQTIATEVVSLPCDVAFLMCDPEWKIKTEIEILVFIHRPQEDFSDLLGRWRQTQIFLDRGYEWLMPPRHKHLLNQGSDTAHPLFVVFPQSPIRIKRGLESAFLPVIMQTPMDSEESAIEEPQVLETLFDDLGVEELEIPEGGEEQG